MTDSVDPFDAFLRQSLAPPDRAEDSAFAAKVAARAVVEARLAADRRLALHLAALQMLAVAALGAAVWAIASAPSVADFAGGNQAAALGGLILLFAAWTALVSRPDSRSAMAGGLKPRIASGS